MEEEKPKLKFQRAVKAPVVKKEEPVVKKEEPKVASNNLVVQIQVEGEGVVPTKATVGSAGYDVRASERILIYAGMAKLVKTGIKVSIPDGYEAQVRSRSGMSLKNNVIVLNAPGTIDSDYRGEVGVILMNVGKNDYQVEAGEKIAQLVFAKVETVDFKLATVENDTDRGEGGFGSTGA
jgi:dUTP pyrophosphatase